MKKIVSVLLCTMFLLHMPGAWAYEYRPYTGSGLLYATAAALTDDAGRPVTQLQAGQTVHASVRVKPGGDGADTQKAVLIAATYVDGFFTEMQYDSAELSGVQELSTSIVIPSGNAGLRLYLWDEVTGGMNARPLFKMGTFGEPSAVEQILVGGEPVAGFDPETTEYHITVNAGYTSWPDIVVCTGDLAADVTAEYTGQFPLSRPNHQYLNGNVPAAGTSDTAVARISAAGKAYTLYITQEVPQITDLKVKHWGSASADADSFEYWSDAQARVCYNISNPVWPVADPHTDTVLDPAVYHSPSVSTYEGYTPVYSDRSNWITFDIAPELLGAQRIILPNAGNYVVQGADAHITFTLDRSARIYYYGGSSKADWMGDDWSLATNSLYESNSDGSYYSMFRCFVTAAASYSVKDSYYMYYKDYEVQPGQKLTVSLPVGRTASVLTFIKYKDTDFIQNAAYTDASGNTAAVRDVVLTTPVYRDGTAADYSLFVPLQKEAAPSLGTGNVMFAASVFSDHQTGEDTAWFPLSYMSELEGGYALQLPSGSTAMTQVSFDLTACADVYVLTDDETLQDAFSGWRRLGETAEPSAVIRTSAADSFALYQNASFAKTWFVGEGETARVTIDLPEAAGRNVMVVVKPAAL